MYDKDLAKTRKPLPIPQKRPAYGRDFLPSESEMDSQLRRLRKNDVGFSAPDGQPSEALAKPGTRRLP